MYQYCQTGYSARLWNTTSKGWRSLDSRSLVQSVGSSERNGRYAHVLNWCEDPLHSNTTLIVKTFLSMIDFFLLMAIWDIYNKLVPEIID